MAFVPVPDTIEVRLDWRLDVYEQAINVLHYLKVDDFVVTQSVCDEIAAKVLDAFTTSLLNTKLGLTVELYGVWVKDISADGLPSYFAYIEEFGTDATNLLPTQIALCTTLRTPSGTRGGRGRCFIPGYTEGSNNDNGTVANTTKNIQRDFIEALRDLALPLSTEPDTSILLGVTSRAAHVGGDPGGAAVPPITRPVISHTTNHVWDTQRRRSNKVR